MREGCAHRLAFQLAAFAASEIEGHDLRCIRRNVADDGADEPRHHPHHGSVHDRQRARQERICAPQRTEAHARERGEHRDPEPEHTFIGSVRVPRVLRVGEIRLFLLHGELRERFAILEPEFGHLRGVVLICPAQRGELFRRRAREHSRDSILPRVNRLILFGRQPEHLFERRDRAAEQRRPGDSRDRRRDALKHGQYVTPGHLRPRDSVREETAV
ncbi:hypothetical protein [Burkholderia ubonensis]|uniref:hypothetical protein n=1 Tax=Burkholderia ubonensis TaxID=101571 RepID=UPI0012F8100E|nr:hypothetical protein [Burkholderia ubonensis]